MLECLRDYIGLRLCSDDVVTSGLYINSLTGISIQMMEASAKSEQATVRLLWNETQEEAYHRFYVDFIMELSKCYEMTPYCDYDEIICANLKVLSKAWRYLLGHQLILYRLFSPRVNFFTSIRREEADELAALLEKDYEKALKQAANLVDVSACCLNCGGNPDIVTWIP